MVDSNVLLDILTDDRTWAPWSSQALADAADRGRLVINPIVYAEVSVRFSRIEALDEALPSREFARLPLPWEGSFLAAKAFAAYRRRGGLRTSTLPDFLIGAHAAVSGLVLLTRDAARYRTYFPTVSVVAPRA